jgi:class 3 adenylate cyclase
MHVPNIKFAKSGDVNIAYDCWGSGPPVIVLPGIVANVELSWEQEVYRRAREYTGKFVTGIEFDKRGQGASDKVERELTLADRIQDVHAIMDAEGLETAMLWGISEGATIAQYFAARYPERVEKLLMGNPYAGLSAIDEFPKYLKPGEKTVSWEDGVRGLEAAIEVWGRDPLPMVRLVAPSLEHDEAFVRWMARFERMTATQSEMRRLLASTLELDANAELANITAPTLVIHASGDRLISPTVGRYVADRIPGAHYEEFDSDDHMIWVSPVWREVTDCAVEFLTGVKPGMRTERKFATVLFSDIVDSTARASEVGDEAWSGMLDRHDRIAWDVVQEHRGKLVKNTGDGLLLTFDAPSDAIAAASALTKTLRDVGLETRVGVHAGEIEVRADGDVSGLAVNLAARVQDSAEAGATYVSSTLRDMLLGGSWSFKDRGEHTLKGIDGGWRLYELTQ